MSEPILKAVSLVKHYPVRSRFLGFGKPEVVRAVDGVSLDVQKGETFALVGESGCGKTTLGRLLMGLIPPTAGTVYFKGRELRAFHRLQLRKAMQIVFQDPLSSLNPRKSVRAIIGRPLAIHRLATADPETRIRQLLGLVQLEVDTLERYPHEFSGGQQQRIAIARALATEPEVLVADEPVSALDVSVQAQIVALLTDLQASMGLTLIMITHDLALVNFMADRLGIMYMGEVVEMGNAAAIFSNPLHPYTVGLLASTGVPDPALRGRRKAVQGELPSAIHPPSGCRFRTRCPLRLTVCEQVAPELVAWDGSHQVACHRYPGVATLPGGAP